MEKLMLYLIGFSCVIALIAIIFFKDMEKNYKEGLDAFSKSNGFTSSLGDRIILNEFVKFASLRDEKHILMYARQEEFKSKYFTQSQVENMSPSQTRRSHWILLRIEIEDVELKTKLESQIAELIKKFEWNRFEKEMDGDIYLSTEDNIAIDICLPYYLPSTWAKIELFLRQVSALI